MTTFPWFRALPVIMALAAVSAPTYVAISLAAPVFNVVTAPEPKVIEQADDKSDPPPTSEELIAAALKTGTITYEESLRQRAYALYDDPQLRADFRSKTIDWEAGMKLFIEIDRKEETLSKDLLADLAPFRARPNDPISIFNRPRKGAVTSSPRSGAARFVSRSSMASPLHATSSAAPSSAAGWESRLVRGTNVRIWINGSQADLDRYEPMVGMVWRAFPDYFVYPLEDNGKPETPINCDGAIDIYFLPRGKLDPRSGDKFSDSGGMAQPWKAQTRTDHTSSGYLLINTDRADNLILGTIAHELAHVSQMRYDTDEIPGENCLDDCRWLMESTATWVSYKVMKSLGKTPEIHYGLLDPRWVPPPGEKRWPPLFDHLHETLNSFTTSYGSWLFFYSASKDLGDGIVKAVWQQAAAPGPDGIRAANKAIPFDEHFPRFTVRNWNRDLVPDQWPYKKPDDTFPPHLKPKEVINAVFRGPGTEELAEPVANLAARYYDFTFVDSIRKVTFQNRLVGTPNAHVWAIKKINNDWKEPEDWTKNEEVVFCRDVSDENLTDLVIVVSNSHMNAPLPPHPLPRIVADAVGCDYVEGWAKATLRVKDDTQDVSYVSSRARLRFKPRASPLQNMPGNTQYDLMPTSVTWTAAGTVNDCTISGQILVNIPAFLNQPLAPTRPAWGYLNVVGLDGGDFHSVEVLATDPDAKGIIMTCPGDPPAVTEGYFQGQWLLHILYQPNTYEGATVAFKGTQRYDAGDPMGFLSLLPPGFTLPGIARQALPEASTSGTSRLNTWEWELRPLTVGQTAGN